MGGTPVTLDEARRVEAELDRECDRSRLVGEQAWLRLWVYFCHAHRDLWSVPGGWESHGDHEAFVAALGELHGLRQRIWVLSDPSVRGPAPAPSWDEQVRRYGGLGDVR